MNETEIAVGTLCAAQTMLERALERATEDLDSTHEGSRTQTLTRENLYRLNSAYLLIDEALIAMFNVLQTEQKMEQG